MNVLGSALAVPNNIIMEYNYNAIIINGTDIGIGLTQAGKCRAGPWLSSGAPVMMEGEEDPGAAEGGRMT